MRKFAPCANLTNLKEVIVSKKGNITNSERTGKKDNVSDTVNFAPKGRNSAIRRCFLLFGAKDVAYTALERSDNARVRKFAPCANLTNLKGAIVSKKENITNSERTGKKDNVSDTVNFAPKGRNSAIRRCFLLLGAKDVAYTALERSDNARVRKFAAIRQT